MQLFKPDPGKINRCHRFALPRNTDDVKPLRWVLRICSVLTIHLTLGFPCISLQNSASALFPARHSREVPISNGYLPFIHCAVRDDIIGLPLLNKDRKLHVHN